MNRSIVIYAPPGHPVTDADIADLQAFHGLGRVLRDWDGTSPLPAVDTLVITHNADPRIAARPGGAMHIGTAMRRMLREASHES